MSGSMIDDKLTLWVATHRWPPLNEPLVWLGTIEKLGAVWIVFALIIGLATRRGAVGVGGVVLLTAVTTFVADAASFGLKDLVHRPRPFVVHPQIHPLYVVHSSSFPAGHAATAFAGATILSYLATRATPFFVALAVAIGFSRVYVGDHYPSDVLGGAMVGALVGLAAIVLVRAVSEHGYRLRLLVDRIRPAIGGRTGQGLRTSRDR
jgi:undecaprenyl-diphosphatase